MIARGSFLGLAGLIGLGLVAREVTAQPAPDPASDDLDATTLAGLGLDETFDDALHLYGFIDFGVAAYFVDPAAPTSVSVPKETSFYGANVNLYLTRNLSPHWRSMLEFRLVYGPAGKLLEDGTYEHATAPDPGAAGRPVQWGGVDVQRAYLEYEVDDRFAIQFGTFLTPYGIWNVDHGSPAIIPGVRPYIIGEKLFPEDQTGVHVHGRLPFGAYTVGYHATLSNGRGPLDQFHDLDNNKAIGGRLELDTPWLGGIKLGASVYRGRSTDRPADHVVVDADGNLVNVTPLGSSFDEQSVAVDARLQRGPLLLQAEAIVNSRVYRDGARQLAMQGYLPDAYYAGAYLLGAYRLDKLNGLTPFAVAELYLPPSNPEAGDHSRLLITGVGLNYRPIPTVVLKLGVNRATGWGFPVTVGVMNADFHAAWVF